MHQTSHRKNGNDAAEIFDLEAYKGAAAGHERVNLPSLSAKVAARDPAATPGFSGERWHGHADFDKVLDIRYLERDREKVFEAWHSCDVFNQWVVHTILLNFCSCGCLVTQVMKVLTSAGQQCAALAKKRDNAVKSLACVLELQFAWRLTLPRAYVWTQTKGLRAEVSARAGKVKRREFVGSA